MKAPFSRQVVLTAAALLFVLGVRYPNIPQDLSSETEGRGLSAFQSSLAGTEGRRVRDLQSGNKTTVATVVTPNTDLSELCYAFQTLIYAKGDSVAPVLVFDAGVMDNLQQEALSNCTGRDVEFHDVASEFTTFPTGATLGAYQNPSGDWTHHQNERFWTTGIWMHDALTSFDVIMRVEDDTCFTFNSATLPNLPDGSYDYQAQIISGLYEIARKHASGLYSFALTYISENGITIHNPELWANVVRAMEDHQTVPVIQNHFEVVRKSFMQRPDVMAWHGNLTETAPYGYFYHRWATHYERYITMAIFGDPSSVYLQPPTGYVQKDFLSGNFHPRICRNVAQDQ